MTELELRVAATSATFARFNGQPLVLGKTDCARMVAFHLKQLGFKLSLLKAGEYSTEVGARRALERLGVKSVSDLMDLHFPRIAPAEARVGDVLCVRGKTLGDSMQIALHRGHVLGLNEGVFAELIVLEHLFAWRVTHG